MSTFDASLDYSSISPSRTKVQSAPEEKIEYSNDIFALEETEFVYPSAIARFTERHPAFLWFLLANILLAPVLAYAGVQLVASHPPFVTNAMMMSSGVKTMTSSDLIGFVKLEHLDAFWLDSVSGDVYTVDSAQSGINSISYIAAGANLSDSNREAMHITTFSDGNVYGSELKPLSSDNTTHVITQQGTTVEFDTAKPNHMIVTFSNKPEVVVVDFPTTQTATSFLSEAESLTQI